MTTAVSTREKFTFEKVGKGFKSMYGLTWGQKRDQIQMRERWMLLNQCKINHLSRLVYDNLAGNVAETNDKIHCLKLRNNELAQIIHEFRIANFDDGGTELPDVVNFRDYMFNSMPELFEPVVENTHSILQRLAKESTFETFVVDEFAKQLDTDKCVDLLKRIGENIGYTVRKMPQKTVKELV